jgi:hypothetical protein
MSKELISKKTRCEFREYLVSWYLGQIKSEFDAADIPCRTDYIPSTSGQRRTLVEQYYASLDLSKREDVHKLLKVYESVLDSAADTTPDAAARLAKSLEKDGFAYRNREIVTLSTASSCWWVVGARCNVPLRWNDSADRRRIPWNSTQSTWRHR